MYYAVPRPAGQRFRPAVLTLRVKSSCGPDMRDAENMRTLHSNFYRQTFPCDHGTRPYLGRRGRDTVHLIVVVFGVVMI